MPRTTKSLKENFKFKKYGIGEADPNAFTTDFDDSEWRTVPFRTIGVLRELSARKTIPRSEGSLRTV